MNNHDQKRVYICPMHPEIRQGQPGLCPECGMSLVADKKKSQHNHDRGAGGEFDKHAGHTENIFKKRFWASLILTFPVVAYSGILKTLFSITAPEFAGSGYIPAVLGSVIFWYGGWVFITSAVRELKARMPGMMTLIGLAVVTAYAYSIAVTFAGGENLFWELSTLITIMLLGHWIEMRAVQSAQGALKELSKLLPDTAELADGRIVPLAELKEGDIVVIRPGGKIPADGEIIEGASEINESMITGESKPVSKKIGGQVIAGTINGDGSLRVKITKIGEHTFLAGVMRLVAEAQASKSKLQVLSDRAAFWLTIIAVAAGVITFIAWMFAKASPAMAVNRLVAVLVIACPHALGLAIPLVASISTTMAARNGFLIRQRIALESARNIDVVLFDKTGTLTTGEFGVEKIISAGALSEKEILRLAASVDVRSEHFASKAIVSKAGKEGIAVVPANDFQRLSGRGVKGMVDGGEIYVGGAALLDDGGVATPAGIKAEVETANQQGKTVIYVIKEKELVGAFVLADLIREESREAVRALEGLGVKVAMITGDSEGVAQWVANELGISEYFARVLPQDKAEKVKLLQSKNMKVAMVGDGINDAPALTQADLGVAIGAGTNVAIESAGIILVRNDPRDIVKIIKLSRLTYNKMIQNLFWATGYNVAAIPLAAGILASKGILLQPALAALFMSLSTVVVAVNAVLLKRKVL